MPIDGIVRANSFTLPKRQNRISRPLIILNFSGRSELFDGRSKYLEFCSDNAVPPEPYCLVANIDAPLEQNILDLSPRQRIADIHHHHEADYLGRAVDITEGIAHRRRLRNLARRLKPIYSDKCQLVTTEFPTHPNREFSGANRELFPAEQGKSLAKISCGWNFRKDRSCGDREDASGKLERAKVNHTPAHMCLGRGRRLSRRGKVV